VTRGRALPAQAPAAAQLSTILVSQTTAFAVLSMTRERFLLGCRRGDWPARKDQRTWYARVGDIEHYLFSDATTPTEWSSESVIAAACRKRGVL
jgi:hypothetical protein